MSWCCRPTGAQQESTARSWRQPAMPPAASDVHNRSTHQSAIDTISREMNQSVSAKHMSRDPRPVFSVVITSRNRADDLLVAIESALAQQDTSLEVLVYDDASDDGSPDRLMKSFPEIRLFRNKERKGYLFGRNSGYRDSCGSYVVSIDDDAYFSDPHTLARLAQLFDEQPEAGAIALPFTEPLKDRGSGWMEHVPVGTPLRSYVGCAHAVRRELFLPLGGYRELLVHQGEERDFCIRLLESGRTLIYADTPVIVHNVSPNRSRSRMTYYGYRNTLLFFALNVPFPYAFPRMLISCVQLLTYRIRLAEVPRRLWALAAGFGASLRHLGSRQPVSRETYRQYRALPGHGPLRWDASLPVPGPATRSESAEDRDVSKAG